MQRMQTAIKAVKCRHDNIALLPLMEAFRQIVNDCIRIGLEQNVTSLKSLSIVCYPQLKKKYVINSRYKLCAISRASGILRNYRKLKRKGRNVKIPYCTKPVLTTCYGLKVKDGYLHMPSKLKVQLNKYTLQVLSADPVLEVRSVTITNSTLSISFAKKVEQQIERCTGMLGLDRNLDNVTMVDSDGNEIQYDMKKATENKARCKQVKSKFTRNDVRIRRLIFRKYGELERNRVHWIIHNVSRKIVNHAKANKMAIAMEDIKGIRKLYRKGNGQGTKYRGRMNSWSYYELQRQIEYKAIWEGIPVIYVNARGTSAKCSRCGDKMMFTEENRLLKCSSCGLSIDRDINAARNILARGLRFKPVGLADEAMMQEPSAEAILRVDASQLHTYSPEGVVKKWRCANNVTLMKDSSMLVIPCLPIASQSFFFLQPVKLFVISRLIP
ncbi:MAG: IS200/IS605 family element transposase accessory protein TnpB [Thaumarchaeota archaeon]|nr:IS200/IS605 family element transposase accessory protein TnpB [Nitrososphaerota archaeon]